MTTLTKEELKERLLKRGDDPEKIKERLSGSELNLLPEDLQKYAYILVNDNLSETRVSWIQSYQGLNSDLKVLKFTRFLKYEIFLNVMVVLLKQLCNIQKVLY